MASGDERSAFEQAVAASGVTNGYLSDLLKRDLGVERFDEVYSADTIPPAFLNVAVNETVLGRPATTDDVSNVVAFFCSDYSRHITGEVIKVDGGQYI